MNISQMRKMDLWLGVPLTFVCSMLQRIKRLVLPVKPVLPQQVKSILLIELSEMGSMIQLMPMIERLKQTYPQAKITFVTFKSSSHILHVVKNIAPQNIWTLNTKNLTSFICDSVKLSFKLLFTKFDVSFDFELFSRTSSLIAYCSGATCKVGFHNYMAEGLYRGNFLTHAITYNPHLTISKNFMAMLHALKTDPKDIPHCKVVIGDDEVQLPSFSLGAGVVERFRERLHNSFPQLKDAKKIIILNPNSSEALPLRRWPMEKYVELTRRLLELPDVAIVITGSASERADAAYICGQIPDKRIIDLSGYTSMEEVVALYFIAALQITNDSGPAQFAALAKLPTITFFGPETPDLYGALNPNAFNFFKHLHCSPCYTAQNNRTSPCKNNVCMQLIEIDEVHAKALEMLK